MGDNVRRKCLKCGRSPREDPEIKLYRFPKPGLTNSQRCELWAKYCFPEGAWASIDFQRKLYGEHRMLCNHHFKMSSYTDFAEKKLNRHAFPDTDHIENQQPIQIPAAQPETSHFHKNVISGPLQRSRLLNITNIQKSETSSTVDNIQLDTSKTSTVSSHSQPGPSGVSIENIKELNLKSETSSSVDNIQLDTSKTSTVSCLSQPGPSGISIEKIKELNLKSKAAYTVDNIPLDTSIKVPQPGPSGVLIEKTKRCDSKLIPSVAHDKKNNPLYIKCKKYMKKVSQLRYNIKNLKKRQPLKIIDENEAVQKMAKRLTPSMALILQGELKNAKRKYKGRRWTTEQKIIALRIYKRSPTTYRLLRRLWCLPAPSTLKNTLGQFDLNVGINDKVFKSLKNYTLTQDPINNQYMLMFDEMSIKKHLWYNSKEDKVEGYQDHGKHGRTQQEAIHALVFMITGIRKKVKQPVAFYLSSANVTADRLSVLIKDVLHKCLEYGINIAGTVCDMGGVNRRALTVLGANRDKPYFNFEGREVVTIFDSPHLLKCFRNMFLKYDIKCKTNITSNNVEGEGVAKWKHIEDFFEVDNLDVNFVYAPKLKKDHLNPNAKQKMRVNLAAQVFSHSVAVAMFARIAEGLLPAEATTTAQLIFEMDKLFDCLNSESADLKKGKSHSTNMSEVSPHLDHLKKMKILIENLEYIGCHSTPPSKQGWIWTINGVIKIFENLKRSYGIKTLSTRRLQQDPLENLFGTIRGNCGANYNPTTGQFIAGLKTAILSNLAHMGSGGNCKEDECSSMADFKEILCPTIVVEDKTNVCLDISEDIPLVSDMLSAVDSSFPESVSDSQNLQATAYVCGFLLKNLKNECKTCDMILRTNNPENLSLYNFIQFKEYDDVKKRLNYASEDFIKCVDDCATNCNQFYQTSSNSLKLKKTVLKKLTEEVNFTFLYRCQEHLKRNMTFIINGVFHITIKRFCTIKNRQFADYQRGLKRKINIVQNK